MKTLAPRAARIFIASGLGLALACGVAAAEQRVSKDQGPASASCDTHAKGSAAWSACVGSPVLAMADDELFYAGYWLARNGRYAEALDYLSLAREKDERVLTYMGFATRKLGRVDEAMPLYAKALSLNPDYAVARAYLGEAHLSRGDADKARGELNEIAQRCGQTCAPYADLAAQIRDYEDRAAKG